MATGPLSTTAQPLLARLVAVSTSALENGALKPLQTEQSVVAEGSTKPGFLLTLLRKHHKPSKPPSFAWNSEAVKSTKTVENPFLPYDEHLYVRHVSPAHVLLLNKFPVIQNHALLVTREFQPQSSLLTFADHLALWNTFSQINALAFYNAGPIAGASQPHKHLQIIPVPLEGTPFESDTPFDRFLEPPDSQYNESDVHYRAKGLPFLHATASMLDVAQLAASGKLDEAAGLSMRKYTSLMTLLEPRVISYRVTRNAGVESVNHVSDDQNTTETSFEDDQDDIGVKPFSYNLVVTRRYMLVVPRRKEKFQHISVNALGFVGCLLVKDDESLQMVKNVGPMNVLSTVALPDDAQSTRVS